MVGEHHRAHPLRPGMPREELRSRLGLPPAAFTAVARELVGGGLFRELEGELALPEHEVRIDPGLDGPAGRLLEVLGRTPYAPPSLPDAMREAGAGPEVLRALSRDGRLVRLSDEVAFTREAYEAALTLVREIVAAEAGVTVARLRDAMAASRRPVLAFLEHLDSERVTIRRGETHWLRGPV